jgi:hypothetical protein
MSMGGAAHHWRGGIVDQDDGWAGTNSATGG